MLTEEKKIVAGRGASSAWALRYAFITGFDRTARSASGSPCACITGVGTALCDACVHAIEAMEVDREKKRRDKKNVARTLPRTCSN
jgi:hypothetical protein